MIPGKIIKSYPVTGLSCASCAARTEKHVKNLRGVSRAVVNYADSSLLVEFSPGMISASRIRKAVQSIGYDIIIDEANSIELLEEARYKRLEILKFNTISATLFSIPLFIISMFFMNMPRANFIMMLLAIPVVFVFGREFPESALRQLKHGSANMDTLVALSSGIAFIYSAIIAVFPSAMHVAGLESHVYFEASAVIVNFILLGRFLEEKAKTNTSSALRKLIGLQAKTVIAIRSNGEEAAIPTSEVIPGDILLAKPGDKIAVDGIVTSGYSFIDESMITGEVLSREITEGAMVYAGTLNQKGSFMFRALKVGSDTILSQIIRMVREAQGSKAPVQHLVDRIAAVFVPAVIIVSILSGLAWFLSGSEDNITRSIMAVVTVLIIACPCALGLATPTAIMVGIGKGADKGILIKDAESLEIMHEINAVVLDKTGTITLGQPVVHDITWGKNSDTSKNKLILLGIEKKSDHPLAEPVVKYLLDEGNSDNIEITSVENIPGRGIKAAADGETFYIGNRKLMEENNIALNEELNRVAGIGRDDARSLSFFSDSKKVISVISISDTIKDTSREAIKELHDLGIEVHMLTGDNEQSAALIAAEAGIDKYRSEMLPGAKHDYIKELQERGKIVAMAGDGINDSQALARADVSIAMGKGSDIAIDTAKMTILSSDLTRIPVAVRLSRQTVTAIRQNLFWAFLYNIIAIPVAAGILYPFTGFLMNPMTGGAAMAMSSLSVLANSLRLRRMKLS